jgi:phenylalanyl-tRNA synthetase beta chain
MKILESWLRGFVNPELTTAQLAHRLTMSGAEVEECASVAPPFEGVLVAQVVAVEKHPNADKLSVCQVDAGAGLLNIVCGAPNVRAGIKVPFAQIGAVLPGGFEIKLAKMRGVQSEGMLCSARELGLSDDHSGLLILDDALPIGASVRQALDLDDQVLTLKLTPNKADCLSVYGIAREVAAITGAPLKPLVFEPVAPNIADVLPVRIAAPDLCGRFSGRVVRNVNCQAPTPAWMKSRLERAGQRSISALVDISNYVMLELGRPTHIFDLDKIQGGLSVRWGQTGETLKLLNGNTVTLDETLGVIADQYAVESLAGIMGGDATAVGDETRNVYVEAAFWWPDAIRGRSRRFNFSTDAGHRFERGVDPATTVEHIEYITRLILDVCGGADTQIGPVDDQITGLPARPAVRMRIERCRKVIGAPIPAERIAEIFTRLGLRFEQGEDAFVVTPPSFRFDLEIEEDLIEEVARIWGFENLPVRPPLAPATMRSQSESKRSQHQLRLAMAALGYAETVNFSFVDASWEADFAGNREPIRLLNPIASNLAVMRTSLVGSLVDSLVQNLKHRPAQVRIFEIGRVYRRDTSSLDGPLQVAGVDQPMHIAALAYGPAMAEQWGVKPSRLVDFFDVKGDFERLAGSLPIRFVSGEHPALHPGRCAHLMLGEQRIGLLGELHPRWLQKYELPQAPVVFECAISPLLDLPLPHFEGLAHTPAVIRDIAVIVNESVPWEHFDAVLSRLACTDALHGVLKLWRLFDVYRGAGLPVGHKSLALRLWLQDTSETLNEEKVEQIQQLVFAALAQLGARLR